MKKIENDFKSSLVSDLKPRMDVQSHEDSFSTGIPDLSYGLRGVNGWIELKQIKYKTGTKLIKPAKYTPQQVNWLKRRGKHAGHCFVMCMLHGPDGTIYTVHNYDRAADVRKGMPMREFLLTSLKYWRESIDLKELMAILSYS